MRNLPGLYKAVCLETVNGSAVRCKVPQVFADEVVTCLASAGGLPAPAQEGWVSFESGFPDRPVWVGVNFGREGATTLDELDDVDTTTDPPSPGEGLVWDGSQWVPSSTASLDHRYSNTPPTDLVDHQLWFDSDLVLPPIQFPLVYATVALLKVDYPSPPDGMLAWITGEDAMCIGKSGTWRYLNKHYPYTVGNTSWLTWQSWATAASSRSQMTLNGKQVTLWISATLAAPSQSGSAVAATIPSTYYPTAAQSFALATQQSAAGAGSGFVVLATNGNITPTFAALNNPTNNVTQVHATLVYTLADLVAA